nr:hypothetical protein [uncultured Methanoregula sp.]
MLQITSGKFFKTEDRYIFEGKGILYSNYSWVQPIETCIAKLDPVDGGVGLFPPYIITFKNQLEKDPNSPLIGMADHIFIKDFQIVSTFGLKSLFINDKKFLEFLCRKTKNKEEWYIPSELVPRFFDESIHGTIEENQKFVNFISKIIGLPRKKYNVIKTCLEAFSDSLIILNYNFELAYSLLVFCLETVSQNFESYEVKWDDYDSKIRISLEDEFLKIDKKNVENIKKILLTSSHSKLTQRFIDFIVTNTSDNFFTDESTTISPAIRKSEFRRVIKNTYSIRSQYAHGLKTMMLHSKMPNIVTGDVYHLKNEPYLTYQGLLRLTHHVLLNVINSCEILEKEEYNWQGEIPGCIEMELASKYWISNVDSFEPKLTCLRLNAFLSQIEAFFLHGNEVSDLDNLMDNIEIQINQASPDDKIDMYILYFLYHLLTNTRDKRIHFQSFLDKNQQLCEKKCIENMVPYIFLEKDWSWSPNDCAIMYDEYQKTKFSRHSIRLPRLFETALIAKIANSFLSNGDEESYVKWGRLAIAESSGFADIQKSLLYFLERKELISISSIILKKKPNIENNA